MATNLGASFEDTSNLITSFPNPQSQENIFFYLDACHMLKLIRNCLASQGKLTHGDGNEILWIFFENLVNLQNIEGLHAATKLRKRHLQWAREKMKVKIAAQTFSNSVADAFLFLCLDLQHEDFLGATGTATFCKIFNNLFDILNSRNWASKTKYRKPLSMSNHTEIIDYLKYCKNYILGLKLNGVPVVQTNRRTGFLGFLVDIESLMSMFTKYIQSETPLLKYILTYKISQDHLEIFFSAVRSRGGSNNNPTCKQFEAIYKRLLLHTEIKGADSGNAVAIDNTSLLHCSSRTLTCNDNGENLQDTPDFIQIFNELQEHDYISTPVWHLTTYTTDIVAYISGFVVKCLTKCISCAFCLLTLENSTVVSLLQQRKQYGRMVSASPLVIKIFETAEKCLRVIKAEHDIFHMKNLPNILINSTIRNLPLTLFDDFAEHMVTENILNNHCLQLIKLILEKYFKLRLHHETTRLNDADTGNRVRSMLAKTILFKGQ
jgi:hypothetical protein